jgi:LmbE family N-acetylglucosaminyl deacetylase
MGAHCIGITVFAAPHDESVPLSPFMQEMHEGWERAAGMPAQAINAVRRREEDAAMRVLGLHHEWLDFMDAPYRRDEAGEYPYASSESLFGTPVREERVRLAAEIAEKVRAIATHAEGRLGTRGRVRVFAPLAVGRHVDHQLVFLAARRLGPRFGVLFYEDYPYAARAGALQARLAELGMPAQARATPISDLIGVKIASIARYKSQLEMLFVTGDAMPEAVRTYTGGVAADAGWAGEYAERVWQLPPVYALR